MKKYIIFVLCVIALSGCEIIADKKEIITDEISTVSASLIKEVSKITEKKEEIPEEIKEEETQEEIKEEEIKEEETQEENKEEETQEEIEVIQEKTEETRELQKQEKKEEEKKLVSFIDIRKDFWFTDNGYYPGGFYDLPSSMQILPDFYSESSSDFSQQWLYAIDATFFKYYGELLTAPYENRLYIFNSGEEREKNIWAENEMKRIANSLVYKGISEEEAVENIIEYIKNNFSYMHTGYETGEMYTMLATRKGNCEAYARLFKEMCNFVGIECKYVEGNAGEDHAWNKVLINDTWYWVDITWYDTGAPEYKMSKTLWNDHFCNLIVD